MKPIGGYFEFELPAGNLTAIPSGVLVNSGRHALEYIIQALGNRIKTIWLPYYTCEVVLEPIRRLGIDYNFYSISEKFEIDDAIELSEGEYIIANNYFGIKDSYISGLVQKYKDRLIIDNAQAFYSKSQPESNQIYSPRKFFGVPDGGIVSSEYSIDKELPEGFSYGRCSHLLKRLDKDAGFGYTDFKANDRQIKNEVLTRMSKLTKRLLSTIDFDYVRNKRRANYKFLHNTFASTNRLELPDANSFACPMVYPYLTDDPTLRNRLIENGIFVATYWPNVLEWCEKSSVEYHLAQMLIPLPIDQRYNEEDMQRIINLIN